jgi:hypothetical protein
MEGREGGAARGDKSPGQRKLPPDWLKRKIEVNYFMTVP